MGFSHRTGQWGYRYRAIDAGGQVIDVLLRTHRDLDSARTFFVLAAHRRRRAPEEVITDNRPADGRAVRDAVPWVDEGPAAADARAPIDPHAATHARGGRTGTGGAAGPIGAPPDAGAGGGTGTQMPPRVAATIYMWLADRLRVAA